MLRLVALMNVLSHVILDAQLSPYRGSEIRLAETFLGKIPANSITLSNKGFWGADLLLSVADGGSSRHWLTPTRKGLVMEEVERYGEHDCLVWMKVSLHVRKRNPSLPTHWEVREVSYESHAQIRSLFTSLPVEDYTAGAVAGLQRHPSGNQPSRGSLWLNAFGHTLQTRLSVHHRSIDRHGGGQSGVGNGQKVG